MKTQLTNEPCPWCGSKLYTNKLNKKWCSNAGDENLVACGYGLISLTEVGNEKR